MDHQFTFADSEFSQKCRKTRKDIFLERMDNLIPWKRQEKIITPHYPKAGKSRQPYPLYSMLRIHCMQNWLAILPKIVIYHKITRVYNHHIIIKILPFDFPFIR